MVAPAPAAVANPVPATEPVVSAPVTPATESVAAAPQAAPVTAKEEAAPVKEPVVPVAEVAAAPAVSTTPAPASVTTNPETTTVAAQETPAAPQPVVTPVAETAPTPVTAAPSAEPAASLPVTPAAETVAAAPAPAPEPVVPAPAPEPVAAAPVTPSAESVTTASAVDTPAPASNANPGVAIDRFEFSYGLAHPALPPLEELQKLKIKTTRDGNIFRAPAAKGAENLVLGSIPAGSRFDADALRGIAQEVVRWYNSRGLYGVWVQVSSELEASNTGLVDTRKPDDSSARFIIWASQVSQVRTLARGKRINSKVSINNPKHQRIITGSPIHAGSTPDHPGSLFNKTVLDDYLLALSLHPGRRVEASIASAGEPGKVVLDYLVNEAKAYQLFAQVNNFGSKQTGVLRSRVGYQDNQLTNHDDVLNLDLISTKDFKTYATFVSYRLPLWRPAKVLMRIYGSSGDFATIPADNNANVRYTGKNWQGGIEFTNRLILWRGLQLNSSMGANYNHYSYLQEFISTTTTTTSTTSSSTNLAEPNSNFLVPFVSVALAKDATWWSVEGSLRVDDTLSGYANEDKILGIQKLGRSDVDTSWVSGRWSVGGAMFVEPLFKHGDQQTLANELSLRVRGRKLLQGTRVISQEMEPLGGGLTIRGYPESAVAADEFYIATLEYAYHVPRALKPADPGRSGFKWHPTKSGQNPDWDLALRAFYDSGHRGVGKPLSNPDSQAYADKSLNMRGTGLGLTLSIKQYLMLHCDFGMALDELRDTTRVDKEQVQTPKGNKQVSVVSTFIW